MVMTGAKLGGPADARASEVDISPQDQISSGSVGQIGWRILTASPRRGGIRGGLPMG